jgi:hypothetical protein
MKSFIIEIIVLYVYMTLFRDLLHHEMDLEQVVSIHGTWQEVY